MRCNSEDGWRGLACPAQPTQRIYHRSVDIYRMSRIAYRHTCSIGIAATPPAQACDTRLLTALGPAESCSRAG